MATALLRSRPRCRGRLAVLARRGASSTTWTPKPVPGEDATPSASSLAEAGKLAPHTTTTSSSSSSTKAYSHTLLLPKPSFPLTPPPATEQRERFGRRTGPGLYTWQRSRPDAQPESSDFVFLDGPPYANGDLHMGHAMNKVLKDVINRYQVLQGRRVTYVPGWDCHGLPIENKALKALEAADDACASGESAGPRDFTDVPPAEIRAAARRLALESVDGQRKTFEQLGVMADWAGEITETGDAGGGTYRSLDQSYVTSQLTLFKHMVERGLVYGATRPTYYSPSSRTALAEAELKYVEDHVSESCWVRLAVPSSERGDALSDVLKAAGEGETAEVGLVIWTTTAWTLGSNMAVMIHPELSYTLLRSAKHGLLVGALDRIEALSAALDGEALSPVGAPFPGSTLLSTRYKSLFAAPTSGDTSTPPSETKPVISAGHVTSQSGSGLVHCAPAHGLDDYLAFSAAFPRSSSATALADLPSPIDDSGCFVAGIDDRLVGLEALGRGSDVMRDILREQDVLLRQERVEHKYPYDWKTKQPVLVRATRQWFANLDGIKEQALEALKYVQFVPASSRARLESFVRSRSEWCISRQRTWGVPIPALYSLETGEPHLSAKSMTHILGVLAANGGEQAWWDLPAEDFVSAELASTTTLGKAGWRKGTDTMDVWFDSGAAWSLLPARSAGPDGQPRPRADVVLEGSDQHRGWFQSLLLTYLSADGAASSKTDKSAPRAPYGTVITHGMVLDSERNKMSKSDGNILAPATVMDGSAFAEDESQPKQVGGKKKKDKPLQTHFGPDTLRVWAASSDYTSDSTIGKQAIDEASNHLFLVRRILRFLSGSVDDSTRPITEHERDELTLADKYVLHLLTEFDNATRQSYDSFAFHPVMKDTVTLLNHLSAFYIDMTRDSLYSDLPELPARQVVLSIFQAVLNGVSQSVAPIAPFMVEELAEHRKDVALPAESAFSLRWQTPLASWKDAQVKADMQALLELRTHVSALLASAREDKKANVGRMSHLEMQLDSSDLARVVEENRSILTNLFGVSHVTIVATPIDEPQPWEYSTSVPTSAETDDPAARIELRIYPSAMHKCPRCWDFTSPREEMLCVRCETVVREFEGTDGGAS